VVPKINSRRYTPAMTQPGIADLMSQWKSMSDQFLKQWGQVYEATSSTPEGQAMTGEIEKNYVAARAAMAKAAREAYGPIVEAVGAVPLVEFQRLQDQVHTILLRLDRIDDALATLLAAQAPEAPKPKKKKK
jgi:hypothetical protein